MANYWGVDSADFVYQQYLANCGSSKLVDCAENHFSNAIAFWGRYFGPAPFTPINKGNFGAEATNLAQHGIRYMVPLADPPNGRTSGSQGSQDGKAVCDALDWVLTYGNGHYALPSNLQLRVYLDVESGVQFTYDYWYNWSYQVAIHQYPPGAPSWPYYPSIYCNPADGIACGVISNALPDAVWTSTPEHQDCSWCNLPNGPGWGSSPWHTCNGIYNVIWQYAEYNNNYCGSNCCQCSGFPPVNLDQSTPGEDERAYMLFIS